MKRVEKIVGAGKKVMVFLDSMHTHKHVLKELRNYSKFVKKGSYIIVFDTMIENMPKGYFSNRPWEVGNNPKTAVQELLKGSFFNLIYFIHSNHSEQPGYLNRYKLINSYFYKNMLFGKVWYLKYQTWLIIIVHYYDTKSIVSM